MKRLLHTASAAAFAIALAMPAQAQQAQCDPRVQGEATARLVGTALGGATGSASGFGDTNVQFNPNGTATVRVNTFGVPGALSAGLYRGAEGSAGTLVQSFTDAQNVFNNGALTRTVELSEALTRELREDPDNFFVRVDSPEFPSGALRGQLDINRSFGGGILGQNVVGGPQSTATGAFTSAIRTDAQGRSFLDIDVRGNELGSSLTNLVLGEGAAGEQGRLRHTFGNDLALTNGRYQTSIELNDQLLRDLSERPENFYLQGATSEFPMGAFRGQLGWSNETYVPVFGSVSGAHGSEWRSDLRIFNGSFDEDAMVLIEWFPRASEAGPATEVATITVPARGTAFFADSMAELFPNQRGIGALRITTNNNIVASARVYNIAAEGPGTFGQAIPGLTSCAAISRGVISGLMNSTATGATAFQARTNVGFFNPTMRTVTVNLELHNATGARVANRVITIGPRGQMQMPLFSATGGLFDGDMALDAGTLSFHATNGIFAYASVVDNTTGDPTTLLPQADFSVNNMQ